MGMTSAEFIESILLNACAAFGALLMKTIRWSGAIVGFVIGTVVYLGASRAGWGLLFLFFFLGSSSTLLGMKRKKLAGTAQPYDGKRGASEALAKAGVPFLLAIMMLVCEYDWLPLAFCGGISAATADTLGSEIGPLTGGAVRKLPRLLQVTPGTPGGISLGGSIAAIGGAFLISIAGREWMGIEAVIPITIAGFLASLIDGLIASVSIKGRYSHHIGNIIACGSGAGLSVLLQLSSQPGGNS